jgi:hypothetical protein
MERRLKHCTDGNASKSFFFSILQLNYARVNLLAVLLYCITELLPGFASFNLFEIKPFFVRFDSRILRDGKQRKRSCARNRLPHHRMGFDRWDNASRFRNHRFDILLFRSSRSKSNRRLAAACRRRRVQKESSRCDLGESHELLMALKE